MGHILKTIATPGTDIDENKHNKDDMDGELNTQDSCIFTTIVARCLELLEPRSTKRAARSKCRVSPDGLSHSQHAKG